MVGSHTMRHISVWLVVPALIALLSVPVSRSRRWVGVGLLVAGLGPLMVLMVHWGGPLPHPAGTPAEAVALLPGVRLRNLLLSLGVVGMYGVFMLPAGEVAFWWQRAREHRTWWVVLALLLVTSVGLLAAGALTPLPDFLALVSRLDMPQMVGTGLAWWLLVPIGAAATTALVATRLSDVKSRLLVGSLLGLLASAMANPRWLERYVDFPFLLLLAALAIAAGLPLGWADRLRWLAVALLAIAAFVFLV